MISRVPEATVVIVNPTHYAVALKWDRFSPHAPIVVASGVDHVAAAIRELGGTVDQPAIDDVLHRHYSNAIAAE